MPLSGTLKDLSLANLVQLQCNEQHPARVRLVRRGREGTLFFANGELIHASVDNLTGEDAVYELLGWDDGEFHVIDDAAALPRNVNMAWNALLLEGLRRLDEARAERHAALEATLQGMKGREGLRAALMVTAAVRSG